MYNSEVNQVSAFDAKTHLSQLLSRVQNGSRIIITKHSTPVAMLVPIHSHEEPIDDDLIESILLARKKVMLRDSSIKKLSIQDLKEEERR